MAEVTGSQWNMGTLRVGTKVRSAFNSSTSDLNSVDVLVTEAMTFKIGMFVYTQQEVANPASVQGLEAYTTTNHPSGTVANIYSLIGNADHASPGTVGRVCGGVFGALNSGAGVSSLLVAVLVNSGANITTNGGPGTITKNVGIQVKAQTAGAENWAIETEGATSPSRFAGSLVVGTAALATSATAPFSYLPSMAGAPTGVPVAYTGTVAHVVDTANLRVYYYVGGTWRYHALT